MMQMDPKFLRNQRCAKKHNRVAGADVGDEQTQAVLISSQSQLAD